MNTRKVTQKIAKILGIWSGSYNETETYHEFKTNHIGLLNAKQLKKLLKMGDLEIKRSGAGLSIKITILK